jgi:uncharacterized membrane protein
LITHLSANTRAYLLLTLTALCWGGNAIFGRLAVGEISPMALVTLRWLGVMLLLLTFAHQQVRRDWPVLRSRLPFIIAMGALGFTAFNALFYVAAHSTTAVNSGIIQGSIPVFVLLGAFAFYRTPIRGLQIAGVLQRSKLQGGALGLRVAGLDELAAEGGDQHAARRRRVGAGHFERGDACDHRSVCERGAQDHGPVAAPGL